VRFSTPERNSPTQTHSTKSLLSSAAIAPQAQSTQRKRRRGAITPTLAGRLWQVPSGMLDYRKLGPGEQMQAGASAHHRCGTAIGQPQRAQRAALVGWLSSKSCQRGSRQRAAAHATKTDPGTDLLNWLKVRRPAPLARAPSAPPPRCGPRQRAAHLPVHRAPPTTLPPPAGARRPGAAAGHPHAAAARQHSAAGHVGRRARPAGRRCGALHP
jgi:hypothetical protein